MEINQIEIAVLEVAKKQASAADVLELSELELGLVGGGMGDVVFA